MSDQELLLAVDGGGTKTQAVVADLHGKVLARGLGPSSNLHNVGFDQSCKAVATAIEGALMHVLGPRNAEGPGWRRARIAAACFGLAGVDAPEDEAQVARWVSEQTIAQRFQVVNDSELVLAGGTPEGWGVALVAGTGSVCLGRSAQGQSLRVGGWGPLIGDEGSGYDIATRALHAATKAADGRSEARALLAAIQAHWALRDASSLIRFVHDPTMTPAAVAGLAALVLDLAGRGDAPARQIVDEAAGELALMVQTVVRRLGLKQPPLALAGGLLKGALRRALSAAIGNEVGPASFVGDPSTGAIVLAQRMLQRKARPS